MAKQQGREMVDEARAYRERVLSELARRRELARQQIEQLSTAATACCRRSSGPGSSPSTWSPS